MNFFRSFCLFFFAGLIFSCTQKVYTSNGELIYNTGKNEKGERLLDMKASRHTFIKSCKTCHGKRGDQMRTLSIKYSSLTNPDRFATPYNDNLFFRFLDKDLKSNGSKADIGVLWKMSLKDKKDLWDYLKTL